MRCARCGAEAEISWPDGQGGQTHLCGPCELILIDMHGGEVPAWYAP